jgi:hypothetical protein
VLLLLIRNIFVMLTTTLRLELARSAASARHVVVFVKGVLFVRCGVDCLRVANVKWRVCLCSVYLLLFCEVEQTSVCKAKMPSDFVFGTNRRV